MNIREIWTECTSEASSFNEGKHNFVGGITWCAYKTGTRMCSKSYTYFLYFGSLKCKTVQYLILLKTKSGVTNIEYIHYRP